ncbi:MAG TPA: glutamate--tRNA ligase [Gaiellaceae bacterium]|nr:glutamate--tRNA ligase [Gaiellaceae bacterium]
MSTIVRFAPSPTGYLHVGGARTALFNWLFARHEGGEFRLRIENTDTSREVAEAVDQIQGTLAWLGLDHDGPVTFQLDRMGEAQEAARRLVDEAKAYEDEGAIRFRMPDEGVTAWDDIVLGRIEVPSEQLDDLVILRSDGRPTYNFVSPLEDALDGITHVIRAQDHVSNTPKQLRILEALGADLPRHAHVPLLNGPDGRKLSKRHGAITVEAFREDGYIPEAFVNFMALLGWSYDDRTEVMSRDELVERFTLERVGKSPAVFDYDKLSHLNGLYLRALPREEYADRLVAYLRECGYEWDEGLIRRAAPLVQEKIETLGEFPAFAGFFFARVPPDGEVDGQVLPAAAETLAEVEPFEAEPIETALRGLAERLGLKPREAFQPIRLAVTGSKVSPGLFESLELLGRDESLARLEGSGRGGASGSSAR